MGVFNIRNQRYEVDGPDPDPEGDAPVFVSDSQETENAFARLCAHSRKFERQHVDYPVSIRLVGLDGAEFDRGRAIICNMTPEGAFIGSLELDRGIVPVDPFHLHFKVENGDLRGIEGSCRPVRITAGENAGFGVTFKQVYVRILGEDLCEGEYGAGLP